MISQKEELCRRVVGLINELYPDWHVEAKDESSLAIATPGRGIVSAGCIQIAYSINWFNALLWRCDRRIMERCKDDDTRRQNTPCFFHHFRDTARTTKCLGNATRILPFLP